jgi:transglutaminase-like putative cysteine protease
MNYRITHTTTYQYGDAVPVCHNQIRLSPRDSRWTQCVSHKLTIRPTPTTTAQRQDWFGNTVHAFSIDAGHRRLSVTASSRVTASQPDLCDPDSTPAWEEIANGVREQSIAGWFDVSEFTFDSPRVISSDVFRDFAAESFPPGRPILAGAVDLSSRIHEGFDYDASATDVTTSPEESLKLKRGVCQDFAHVALAALRSLGVPARYVSGYLRTVPPEGQPRLVGADQSHAWLSVWCGDAGWIDLDPTNDCLCSVDHIPIAWGRDYADVTPISGVFLGGGHHKLEVAVDVEPVA